MFVGFRHIGLSSLAALWNKCLPEPYRITPEILKANTVDCPLFDWGASVVEIDDDAKPLGFVAVKRSAASLYRGPDPDQAHISAVVSPTQKMAVEMIAFVKQNLIDRGVYKIVFGQDSRHFFPGCPTDIANLKDLLMVEGFTDGAPFYDVQQDLAKYQPKEKALQKLKQVEVRRLHPKETQSLNLFLQKEFPGRWAYDTATKMKTEGGPGFVFGIWAEGELKGFALTQDGRHNLPIAGAVFNKGLGHEWCTLGPIGVAKSARGQGLGDALLTGALLEMKKEGKRNCLIDWTVLSEWYGKHGFAVSRTYVPYALKMDELA